MLRVQSRVAKRLLELPGGLRSKKPKRSIEKNALLMDAQIMQRKKECALDMVRRSNYAAVKGAPIKLREEECVLSTGQRLNENYAAVKDAQILLRKEECASGTGQRPNDAVAMDVQTKSGEVECASGTGQRPNDAVATDAQTE